MKEKGLRLKKIFTIASIILNTCYRLRTRNDAVVFTDDMYVPAEQDEHKKTSVPGNQQAWLKYSNTIEECSKPLIKSRGFPLDTPLTTWHPHGPVAIEMYYWQSTEAAKLSSKT